MTIDAALSATDSSSSDAAPSTTPPSTHGTRRPRRERVRSLKAPHTGLANSDTAAPLNRTTASSASLLMPPGSAAATRSACWASSTWIGPNHPAITPRLSSTSAPTQRAGGLSTGSSKAERVGSVVVTASLWGQPGLRDSQSGPAHGAGPGRPGPAPAELTQARSSRKSGISRSVFSW